MFFMQMFKAYFNKYFHIIFLKKIFCNIFKKDLF